MTVIAVDKWDGDRDNMIIAHRNDQLTPFFILPKDNDGSAEWAEVQLWLDAQVENIVEDRLKHAADTAYIANRSNEYPSIVDQLDEIYHNGVDAWKETIRAVKDANPKP